MSCRTVLFTLAAKTTSAAGYYDIHNNPTTPELVESIPSEVELVYWDYYHTVPDIYEQKIQQHRELGCTNPWLASGYIDYLRL